MKLHANIVRTAPTLGYICDVKKLDQAIAEEEGFDFRMISPGYFLCIHEENAYAMSAYLGKTGCACPDMTFRCKGDEACKHIMIFAALRDLPSKPIDESMGQLLKAAGWIGRKLHPPALPKPGKKKPPNVHDHARKPVPQAATRATSKTKYESMTTEQILRSMDDTELRRNASKGGTAAIAELERRNAAGVI